MQLKICPIFFGYRYLSGFDLADKDYSYTDHSDDNNVCKKCFLSTSYEDETFNKSFTQVMLYENSAKADTLYNYYKERQEQANWESKWEYVHAGPVSFYKYHGVTEYNRCFFFYDYLPSSNSINLTISYCGKDIVIDGYYAGKSKDNLKEYLDALDSAGVPIPNEIRGLPENIPETEE